MIKDPQKYASIVCRYLSEKYSELGDVVDLSLNERLSTEDTTCFRCVHNKGKVRSYEFADRQFKPSGIDTSVWS